MAVERPHITTSSRRTPLQRREERCALGFGQHLLVPRERRGLDALQRARVLGRDAPQFADLLGIDAPE